MKIDVMDLTPAIRLEVPKRPRYEDPLDRDEDGDVQMVVTRRSLVRIALVAAEAASRFARESAEADPVAWMLTPRRLFDRRAAIEACLGRDDCLRAVLLHGLSIGLDADPEDLDELMDDDEAPEEAMAGGGPDHDVADGEPQNRLRTSYLVGRTEDGAVQAFDALIASDRAEAEGRLRVRHGALLSDDLVVVEGFDANLPLAEALVSPALAEMLEQVAAAPASPLARGLSVSIRQRFAA